MNRKTGIFYLQWQWERPPWQVLCLALVLLLQSSFVAAGQPARTSREGFGSFPVQTPVLRPEGDLPFFKGNRHRYPRRGVFSRIWRSVVGAPLNVAYWDPLDLTYASLLTTGAAGLMMPTDPSPDARLQHWLEQRRSPALDRAFPTITTLKLALPSLAFVGAISGVGKLVDSPRMHEYGSLMFEALATAQILHLGAKLMIGRESPYQGAGNGKVHGPADSLDLLPSGTPSGHAATVCSMAGVTASYFDDPAANVVGFAACGYMGASLLYNRQHFISDVLLGGAMGYFVGRWVVRHRASKVRYGRRPEGDSGQLFGFLPVPMEPGGVGAMFFWIL